MDAVEANALAPINDEERAQIAELRGRCAEELGAVPEHAADLVHDYHLARFLRGHQGIEKQAKMLANALAYRTRLRSELKHRALWDACRAAGSIDLSVLPHAATILKMLPIRALEGGSVDGLPVSCSISSRIDLPGFEAADDEQVEEFLTCLVEQRAIVCHTLSVKEDRMAKVMEMRDLTNVSVVTMLKYRGALKKILKAVKTIVDYYPEIIYQVPAVGPAA